MEKIKLKDNELLIFTDFNNTFVDFSKDLFSEMDYEKTIQSIRMTKSNISLCLKRFEEKTGYQPVICIVTNAHDKKYYADSDYTGICMDLFWTFFNHNVYEENHLEEIIQNSCEKNIRYVIHRENDYFYEINPKGKDFKSMFLKRDFGNDALKVHYQESQKKRESVERMITQFNKIPAKHIIFAGDSIQDDYPMKFSVSDSGISKIFIRPGKTKSCSLSTKQKFCEAKGYTFDCKNPKNGKKIVNIDVNNYDFLSEEQKAILDNFDDGDIVLLTKPNSRGFCEGIYQAMDIIAGSNQTYKREFD